jgi:hypothetical protein
MPAGKWRDYIGLERTYVLLSTLSKTTLAWAVYYLVLSG